LNTQLENKSTCSEDKEWLLVFGHLSSLESVVHPIASPLRLLF
jgi:hypothetical protein